MEIAMYKFTKLFSAVGKCGRITLENMLQNDYILLFYGWEGAIYAFDVMATQGVFLSGVISGQKSDLLLQFESNASIMVAGGEKWSDFSPDEHQSGARRR